MLCPKGSLHFRIWAHPNTKHTLDDDDMLKIIIKFRIGDDTSDKTLEFKMKGYPVKVEFTPSEGSAFTGDATTHIPKGTSYDVEIKCTLDAFDFLLNNQTYHSFTAFHDRLTNKIPVPYQVDLTHGSWPSTRWRVSEAYATYGKISVISNKLRR